MKRKPTRTRFDVRYTLEVMIQDNFARLRFPDGGAIGLTRDNVTYYETIGRWLCREVGAASRADMEAGRLP
jgi:hypothetical protein